MINHFTALDQLHLATHIKAFYEDIEIELDQNQAIML